MNGTITNPKFIDGPAEIIGDLHLRQRFFTYEAPGGLVAGKTLNMMLTFDRPARVIWPYIKDLNLWQNDYGHYYSGVLGDLEGKTFRLSSEPNDGGPHQYKVIRVIPEHLIEILQPLPDGAEEAGLRPDCHCFMLNDFGGKTVLTILMEHASQSIDKTEDEALEPWRKMSEESHRKFRDILFPNLRKLVAAHPGA